MKDRALRWSGLASLQALVASCAVLGAVLPARAATYDYCSGLVVRPDQRFVDASTCRSVYTDDEIAAGAEAVWMGDFTDVASPVIDAPVRTCFPKPSHASNAAYVKRLKDARAARGGGPLEIVHMHRFDLVPAVLMAQPPFRVSYLVGTTTPWSFVTDFFDKDTSAACLPSGCRWSDSWGGLPAKDAGVRLRDFIEREAGTGAQGRVVQYLTRPDGTDVYWPTAAIGDLRNPAYRAWRVAEAREALRVGGYTTVDLNHKLHQYRGQHWIGSARFRNVQAVESSGDTAWSAPAQGYGYQEYVQALAALASELRAAGVAYSLQIGLRGWKSNSYDDPSTPANEADLIRQIMIGARVVYLDRLVDSTPAGMLEEAVAGLAQHGVRSIPIDQGCDLSRSLLGPPGAPSLAR
ncbi:hypothetical protein MYXO_02402 [Myxococcaceae bacterium]|jgi:hypothetical protein|nr:hypothetical protein MYXO_02402 [Myxococcaceae bacterium]